jgi:hypothetical protein
LHVRRQFLKSTPMNSSRTAPAVEEGDANSVFVAGNWLERSTVTIANHENSSEIEVHRGATYFGLVRLAHQIGLARKVHKVLAQAPELATSA